MDTVHKSVVRFVAYFCHKRHCYADSFPCLTVAFASLRLGLIVKYKALLLLLIIASAGFAAEDGSSEPQVNNKVVIATGEHPPYTSASLPYQGFINHLVLLAFKEVGIQAEFVFMPWARAMKASAEGRYDAMSYAYYAAYREAEFLYSDNINDERLVLFTRKDLRIREAASLADLHSYRLGLTRGYTYNQAIQNFAKAEGVDVSVVSTDLQNLHMLLIGRIDIFPIDEMVGWFTLEQNFSRHEISNITTLNKTLQHISTHLAFSHKRPSSKALRQAFNQGLKILTQKGIVAAKKQDLRQGKYSH